MLSAVLGLFSQDLAIDLGTSTTRIYQRGQGVVCAEPTLLAIHTDTHGRRRVLAVGDEARPMIGRTPGDIRAVAPVRAGQIEDYEVAEALLLHLMRRIHGRAGLISPRLVMTVPFTATEMERRAARVCCESAGARNVHLVERPLAAALGAELPVHEPSGHMVVDLGGGSTEISILSLSGVVSCVVVPGGGDGMDDSIAAWLRDRHQLFVGRATATRLKHELGSVASRAHRETSRVSGRCLREGIPRTVEVRAEEVHQALAPGLEAISRGIRHSLEHAPPELGTDVLDHGLVLTGGGSRLDGIESALRDSTGLPVICAENAERACVLGAGKVLEELDLLRIVAS